MLSCLENELGGRIASEKYEFMNISLDNIATLKKSVLLILKELEVGKHVRNSKIFIII